MRRPSVSPRLVVEPPLHVGERQHDVALVWRTLLERAIPALDIRCVGTLDIKFVISVARHADRYVGDAQSIAAKKFAIGQLSIEQPNVVRATGNLTADPVPLPFVFRGAVIGPENAGQEIWLQRRQHPVHPSVLQRPGQRIGWPEASSAISVSEVAHDRVRLPYRLVSVQQQRNTAMRIHCEKCRLVEAAEPTTGRPPVIRQAQFVEQPCRLLNVERVLAPPKCQLIHHRLPCWISFNDLRLRRSTARLQTDSESNRESIAIRQASRDSARRNGARRVRQAAVLPQALSARRWV
ncbi:hypothetical protein DO71_4783 [Burkholderia pseudomallei]|nr:hypothetical protein DO71_4783 [Burkholderia pseudomallei]